ncbi:N-acetylglucosaminyl-phosphatidylinositol de-N-acetylase [Anopheles moucheti]|uniref:N-acetylglucosaminyl-phosphatidylinositol de-N-acetylase n=1 Tax=Anopheles moucheti TaxID=186751 RepID=UPI0022F03CEC|nr:N-acetylglucosaminyl-phosphatidylinositol de-N-acetylase [Anopheles moucheti]XP_052901985.1 N-acetylglucosaminyl-phosphatidylinositol de-N-acetylase [Anopheles moucheti]
MIHASPNVDLHGSETSIRSVPSLVPPSPVTWWFQRENTDQPRERQEQLGYTGCLEAIYSTALLYLHETLDHLALVLLAYSILCVVLYRVLFHRATGSAYGRWLVRRSHLPPCSRALLVTAHPDDEVMFFGPTILELRRRQCRVFILCLSEGNHDRKGAVRRQELWDACESLGVRPEDITLVNATHLQDDPTAEWKTVTIADQLLRQLESLDAELLITFDKDGISGHPNHCAIYYATASLCLSGMIPSNCKVLTLETVNLCRKYLSIFDLPVTLLLSTNWVILSWRARRAIQNAMRLHSSQMVWFRKLYIVFSRYVLINSLREINKSDVEFEILDT